MKKCCNDNIKEEGKYCKDCGGLIDKSPIFCHEVRDRVVSSIDKHIQEKLEDARHFMNVMAKANNIHELMEAKKKMMLIIVDMLPLNTNHCYFCEFVINGLKRNCPECEYGKVYRICTENNSTYEKLISLKVQAIKALDKYWK